MGFLKYFFKFLVKNYIRVCPYTGKCTYPKLNEFFQSEHTYVPRIKKQNIINTQEPHHTAFQSLPILIVSSIDQFCLSLNSIYIIIMYVLFCPTSLLNFIFVRFFHFIAYSCRSFLLFHSVNISQFVNSFFCWTLGQFPTWSCQRWR